VDGEKKKTKKVLHEVIGSVKAKGGGPVGRKTVRSSLFREKESCEKRRYEVVKAQGARLKDATSSLKR